MCVHEIRKVDECWGPFLTLQDFIEGEDGGKCLREEEDG